MAGGGRRSTRSRIKSSTDADEDEPLRNTWINSKNPRDSSSSLRIFNVRLEIVLGFCVLSFLVIFFLIYGLVNTVEESQRPRVVTPFPAPKLMDLLWTPRSLVAGLGWLGVKDGRYYMRHIYKSMDRYRSSICTRNPLRMDRTYLQSSNVDWTMRRLVKYTTMRFSSPKIDIDGCGAVETVETIEEVDSSERRVGMSLKEEQENSDGAAKVDVDGGGLS
ncbi:hypothetical protein QYF36_004670 [Acer negundo]|nr:hypothetical protein QYF36_004670 [Acer negundo]